MKQLLKTIPMLAAGLLVTLLSQAAFAQDATFQAAGAANSGAASSGQMLAFWIFAGLTVGGAVLTITRRNPVTAALFLILTFFSTGGLYLVLHATFMAAIQVLVYAGAIMVLFMFVVMSVGKYEQEEFGFRRGWFSKAVGIVALMVFSFRLVGLLHGFKGKATVVADGFGDVRNVGELLFSKYLFPFEAISVLLLVAIVGAVMISRRVELVQVEDEPLNDEPAH